MCVATSAKGGISQGPSPTTEIKEASSSRDNNMKTTVSATAPSMASRYTCASVMMAIFAVWAQWTFVGDENAPGYTTQVHSYKVPLVMTTLYLAGLPLLRKFSEGYLAQVVDVKLLLKESMIIYNLGQVLLNSWMVYRFLHALIFNGHPFIGDIHVVSSGATYAVWVHYTDKYLEFLDTVFMVLRGKMDQVSFLHIYHHVTIAWAWWCALTLFPGGDCYFGALLNSVIHVMMYSYYTLSLLKIQCPWKRYLTQAQLIQFLSVLVYSFFGVQMIPPNAGWQYYAAYGIQILEMTSLFLLFTHFYAKAYAAKKPKSPKVKKLSEVDKSAKESASAVSLASTEVGDETDGSPPRS